MSRHKVTYILNYFFSLKIHLIFRNQGAAWAGMKKEHVSENSIMIYDDVMYPDNVTYEHIGEISIS